MIPSGAQLKTRRYTKDGPPERANRHIVQNVARTQR
jgi:hypothetical protein